MMTPLGPCPRPIGRPYNNLLRRLSAADYALLAPHLTRDEAGPTTCSTAPADDVEVVHFPCGPSLASYLVPNEDGRDVETILVGREGAVGGIVSEGPTLPAYTRIMVKFAGPFVRLHVGKLDAGKTKSKTLRQRVRPLCRLACWRRIFQSTACNAIHSIEQRTAKWVISAMERTDDSETVPLTQRAIGDALRRRPQLHSRVMQTFKGGRHLEDRRGSILVRNRDALQKRACLCNEASRTISRKCCAASIRTERGQQAPELSTSILPQANHAIVAPMSGTALHTISILQHVLAAGFGDLLAVQAPQLQFPKQSFELPYLVRAAVRRGPRRLPFGSLKSLAVRPCRD